jgi:6-phosphogluconate dehydrogenase
MQLGMIGLGRMGANMVRRLVDHGQRCVVYDVNPDAVAQLAAEGAQGVFTLEELARNLPRPRLIWLMVPAAHVDSTLKALTLVLEADDVIIDGGNSHYHDDIRRAAELRQHGLHYVDVGTSGGVWGRARGYCLMIGGEEPIVAHLSPIFAALAPGIKAAPPTPGRIPGTSSVEQGYLHCGPSGAGHFVKMVHNGIEYGMMQAYAEGFSILKHKTEFEIDLAGVAELWRHGSVVRSWLLDLAARALAEDQTLESIAPYVSDSGEGRWTVAEAIDLDVPAPVITLALIQRLRSRDEESFADRLLAALRNQFGGHAVKQA